MLIRNKVFICGFSFCNCIENLIDRIFSYRAVPLVFWIYNHYRSFITELKTTGH